MSDLKTARILVTGFSGFIGSNLMQALFRKEPVFLVGLDVLLSRELVVTENMRQRVRFIQGDVGDFDLVRNLLKEHDINIIFHLAAQPIVEEVYKLPLPAIKTNVMGTANILEAARSKGDVEAVIVASSDKAYGRSRTLPYKEDFPLKGDHPYDVSKTAADLLAQTFYETYGLPIAITRFGNVFGPGDTNFNRIVPGIMKAIIFAEKLPIRSDGQMLREYVYVDDVVRGYLKVVENIENIRGEAFNFGSENILKVVDVIHRAEKALSAKVDYEILNIAKNEIPEQYLDWNKARERLGWRPQTSFEEGVRRAFAWYKKFFGKA